MPYRLATSQCLEVALASDTRGIVSRNHHFGKLFFQKPSDKKLLNFLPSSAIIHNTAYAGLEYRNYAAFPRLRGGFDSRIPLHTNATLRGWLFAWSGMWESNRFHATVRWTVAREGWAERLHSVLDSRIPLQKSRMRMRSGFLPIHFSRFTFP